MDSKLLVSLESFKAAHFPPEDDDKMDISDKSESEVEGDNEWLLVEGRKRKRQDKDPAKIVRKKGTLYIEGDSRALAKSGKIEKLCEILEDIRAKDPSEKVIVFSQVYVLKNLLMKFTGVFDFIWPALEARNFKLGRVCQYVIDY